MRLLVVDDDIPFRDSLSSLLEARGQQVTRASTAVEAMSVLERDVFEVMFSANRLGGPSGLELLATARGRWPRMAVVMLSGTVTAEEANTARSEGALDYLPKPVQPEQVDKVLDLVRQDMVLRTDSAPEGDPVEYARSLAAEGGYEVLLISPPGPDPGNGVIHMDLEPESPVGIRNAVEEFARPRERAAVVLAAADRLLARHREEEIVQLLDSLRSLLDGKGPLAVAYDPEKVTATGALAVRASIVSQGAHSTLGSLSSPTRRRVLRRLGEGPCTFTAAMQAAKLDDTSNIAFHLRKLSESGLIEHAPDKRYRLTERGKGAIQILDDVNRLDSKLRSRNTVLSWGPLVSDSVP